MRTFQFNRNKYGTELLIDCLSIKEISEFSTSLKEIHTTSFYEIYFFTCAKGTITVEEQTFDVSESSIVLLPPLVSRKWDIEFKEDSYVIFFDEEIFENILKDASFLYRLHFFGYKSYQPILTISKANFSAYCPLVSKIRNEISKLSKDSPYLLVAYLYELLLEINRDYSDAYNLERSLNLDSEIIRFRNLLKNHIKSKQTVSDYASLMGVTRNKLNSLSLKFYGKNANIIIRNELMLTCKNELLSSNLTIAEICHKLNFSAPSNFTRFFKSHEGISPAKYREKFKN